MAVYEEYLPPKKKRDTVADIVPWRFVAAPGVIGHKDRLHSLQRSYAVRGPDVVGVDPHVQGSNVLQVNNGLKRLGGRWMFQSKALRTLVEDLPPVPAGAPPLVRLLDAAYRAHLLAAPGLFDTTYFHTLTWTPPPPQAARFAQLFVRGPGATWQSRDPLVASVATFCDEADQLMDLLRGVLAECAALSTEETLTYLHQCVSDRWRPIRLPGSVTDIDQYLCDTALDPSGWYPQLGRWHLRTCSLKAYPRESIVGMMRALEAQAFPFSWDTRWLGMEKHTQQGLLRKAERAWVHEEKSTADRFSENWSQQATRVINRDATNKAEEVDIARQEVGADVVAFGDFTSTVTTWHEDPQQADAQRRLIMQVFAAHDIGTVEEGVHQEAAWRSSHPGNRLDNVNATHQSTLTLAHLTPGLTAAWRGPSRDAYMGGGPWFYARTEGHTLFRAVNHASDDRTEDVDSLGHFLELGFTGSGKSTLGNWLRLMWLQYAHTQAKLFDIKRHGWLLTLLLGGQWYDLGSDTTRLQPLRHCDDPVRFPTILEWLVGVCEGAGVANLLLAQRYLAGGLKKLALRPPAARTFSGLLAVFHEPPPGQSSAFNRQRIKMDGQGVAHLDTTMSELDQVQLHVRYVLERYGVGGDYNGIFDGTEEDFDDNPVQTFELGELLAKQRLLAPVMSYVLPQIERQMGTDRKMLLLFDDAALPLKVPRIRADAKDWLRITRKLGVSVGFATHSLDDLFGKESPLGEEMASILLESCPVRFYLPNPEASKPSIRAIYRKLGLEDQAIDQIAVMRPRRGVYYELREVGQRPIALHFPQIILDCIARNSASDHRLIEEILQKEGREGFPAAWFREHGYAEDAEEVSWS
jgi:type IV secretory pathway VirB4 component